MEKIKHGDQFQTSFCFLKNLSEEEASGFQISFNLI